MGNAISLVLDMENDLVHADGPNGKAPYGEQARERRILEYGILKLGEWGTRVHPAHSIKSLQRFCRIASSVDVVFE